MERLNGCAGVNAFELQDEFLRAGRGRGAARRENEAGRDKFRDGSTMVLYRYTHERLAYKSSNLRDKIVLVAVARSYFVEASRVRCDASVNDPEE